MRVTCIVSHNRDKAINLLARLVRLRREKKRKKKRAIAELFLLVILFYFIFNDYLLFEIAEKMGLPLSGCACIFSVKFLQLFKYLFISFFFLSLGDMTTDIV